MKNFASTLFFLISISSVSKSQTYVQKWENWQGNLFVSNLFPDQVNRNVGLQLWNDKAFGMELHWLSRWGTAIYTRSNEEAIWLGRYPIEESQQSAFVPWMTLLGGNVGIGTMAPQSKLDLNGNLQISNAPWPVGVNTEVDQNKPILNFSLNFRESNKINSEVGAAFRIDGRSDAISPLFQWLRRSANVSLPQSEAALMVLTEGGNLGVGTSDPKGYRLAVNGGAIFTKVTVKAYDSNWPDYVFKPHYPLMPLDSLTSYLTLNNHLPEVPSAAEVDADGLDIGGNQAVLLKKIEELTLYIIQLNEQLKVQNQKIEVLENKRNLLPF